MFNKNTLILLLALGWGYDTCVTLRNKKKRRKLVEDYLDALQREDALSAQISYMCHILNENEIQLDEFDLIALPSVEFGEIETESP